MPRRADLVLRTQALQDFLPLNNLKWLSLSEAVEFDSDDFYISGTIVKIYPIVYAKSTAWNYKEHHLGIRKGFIVRDNAPTADQSRTHFSAMFYGTYAQDIDQLDPKEGEVITIANPTGFAPLRGEQYAHLQDFKVLVGQRFQLDSKVCFHSELPSVYLKKLSQKKSAQNNAELLVKEVDLSPRVRKPPQQPKQPVMTYNLLKECTDSKRKYNAFGVVTKISRDPFPTRSGRYMSQVYIRDPESEGTFGFSDYQFSLLAIEKDHIPNIAVNDILRIHAMKPEMYDGNLTFRVFDARSVTVFHGGVNEPIVPESKQIKPMEFTDDERLRVIELRKWWREEGRGTSGAKDSQGMTQDMIEESSTILPNLPFDFYCQIVKIQPTTLTVTDGKKCALNLLSEDGTQACNRSDLTIFSMANCKIPVALKCEQFVYLRGIKCISSHDDGSCYKLVSQFRPQDCKVLPDTHTTVKDLKKAIENLKRDSQEIEAITNDTLKDLFDSQITLDSQQLPGSNVGTEDEGSQPFVKTYPANLDGILVPATDDEQSEEFYTCPDKDRLSPSPEREEEPLALTTNTNFSWTCIEELLKNDDEKGHTFRLKGYIRQCVYGRDWKSNLALICPDCCTVTKYDRGQKSCQECGKSLTVIFHLTLVLEEYSPQPLPRKSPTLKLFLCGSHAARLLQVEAEEYTQTALKRAQIHQKLESLTDKLAVLSVARARASSSKGYGYQIVHTFFADRE